MVKAVGVRFRQAGKIYHFDPDGLNLKRGSKVIVETSRGIEYGEVVTVDMIESDKDKQPLKKVIREADANDTVVLRCMQQLLRNRIK